MNSNDNSPAGSELSRRQFLKTTSLAAATAAAAVSFPSVLRADNKMPIRAIVIGVGGRGSGAGGNFMEAAKNLGVDAKIVAVADIFPESAKRGKDLFGVDEDKCFSGFDAYKKALEIPGVNYCILATPPGFRASHFKACIDAGKNVFCEKPVAVDGAGCRVMYAAAEEAKKRNLKVAAGTQRRHRPSYIETIKRIHDGEIGDVTALRGYWVNGGPIWHRGDNGATELERQIRNWYHYIWLSGDHINEQHVHNIDVCNWVMKGHPVKAWGMGARQRLGNQTGEIWDNFAVEFEYANGVRMSSYCGQIQRSWSSVSEAVVGSNGNCEMHDGRNTLKVKGGKTWKPEGITEDNGYVNEHRDLINAILNDTELNEGKQVTDSTLTAIMGREAAYSGREVDWETVKNAKFTYGPEQLYTDPSKMTWGAFRTLTPPIPNEHDIFAEPPVIGIVKQA